MNIFSNHCIRKQTGMCCRTIESRFGKQLFEVKFIINLLAGWFVTQDHLEKQWQEILGR